MSETKFTPGPWRVCGGFTPAYRSVHSREGYIVFGMADPTTDEEGLPKAPINAPGMDTQVANSHLIAAAPDLYEALKRLLLETDFMVESNVIPDVRNDIIYEAARLALRQAEGGAMRAEAARQLGEEQ